MQDALQDYGMFGRIIIIIIIIIFVPLPTRKTDRRKAFQNWSSPLLRFSTGNAKPIDRKPSENGVESALS